MHTTVVCRIKNISHVVSIAAKPQGVPIRKTWGTHLRRRCSFLRTLPHTGGGPPTRPRARAQTADPKEDPHQPSKPHMRATGDKPQLCSCWGRCEQGIHTCAHHVHMRMSDTDNSVALLPMKKRGDHKNI
jgi:hypothetical protein